MYESKINTRKLQDLEAMPSRALKLNIMDPATGEVRTVTSDVFEEAIDIVDNALSAVMNIGFNTDDPFDDEEITDAINESAVYQVRRNAFEGRYITSEDMLRVLFKVRDILGAMFYSCQLIDREEDAQ